MTEDDVRAAYIKAWKRWCKEQAKFMDALDNAVDALGGKERMLKLTKAWEESER